MTSDNSPLAEYMPPACGSSCAHWAVARWMPADFEEDLDGKRYLAQMLPFIAGCNCVASLLVPVLLIPLLLHVGPPLPLASAACFTA